MRATSPYRRFVDQLGILLKSRQTAARPRHRRHVARPALAACVDVLESRWLLSSIVVSSLDGGQNYASSVTAAQLDPTVATVTLRDAINAANNTQGADTISFDAGLFPPDPDAAATIVLAGGTPLRLTDTTGATTIDGPGATQLAVSGNNQSTVFVINLGVTVTIEGLTITGGKGSIDFGIGSKAGGGIYNNGRLTLQNSILTGNDAVNFGGGLYNNGTVTLVDSQLTNNSGQFGGGFYNGGTVHVTNSTIAGNTVTASGGGFYSLGTVNLNSSTLSGNTAGATGGGFFNSNIVNVASSTIAGNAAGTNGGGFINLKTASILNSTIAGNFAAQGGGIYNSFANVTLTGTILAGNAVSPTNAAPRDWGGAAANVASSYNLFGDGTGSGLTNGVNHNIVGTSANPINPRLAPLGDKGGVTQTMALLAGSPAINAGSNGLQNGIVTDQRGTGFERIAGGIADIGAFEIQSHQPAVPAVQSLVTTNPTPLVLGAWDSANTLILQVTISNNAGGDPRTYTLGTSPELSVSGNTWTLDLAGTTPLIFGTYSIFAHAVNDIGESADSAVGALVVNAPPPLLEAPAPLSTNLGLPASLAVTIVGGNTSGLSAIIDWGDGTTTGGTIATVDGLLVATGDHAYATPGSFDVIVTVTNVFGSSATVSTTATITAPPPVVDALSPLSASVGAPVILLAAIVGGDTTNLSATVDWGDGTTAEATVVIVDGVLTVTGSHAYATAGTFAVQLTIANGYGETSTAATTASITSVPITADLLVTGTRNVEIVAADASADYNFVVHFVSAGVQLTGVNGTTFNGLSTLFVAQAKSIDVSLGDGDDRVRITGTAKQAKFDLGAGENALAARNFTADKLQVTSAGALHMLARNTTLGQLHVTGSATAADVFRAFGLEVTNETNLALGGGANRVRIDDSSFRNFKLESTGSGSVVKIETGPADKTGTQFDGTATFVLGGSAKLKFSPQSKSDRTTFSGNLIINASGPAALWFRQNVVLNRRAVLNNVEIV